MFSIIFALAAQIDLGVEAWLDERDGLEVHASHALSAESQFQAGSISKYACTLIALRLVDEGKLSLDSDLSELLPQYSGPSSQNITLESLLANRSGLPDDLMPAFRADPSIAMAQHSAIDGANKYAASAINPDQGWSYDLGNWIIVQAVIEEATGKRLEQAAMDELFEPAGLSATRYEAGQPSLVNSPDPNGSVRPIPPFLKCAGGLISTPAELLRLVDWAYTDGLARESLERLHSITTETENYTIGGRVRTIEGRVLSWQSGSNGPYKSQLVYDPASGSGWAAMSASNSSESLSQARERWLADVWDN